MESDWKYGDPPKSGYYLAAWYGENRRTFVSELWFNPDAIVKWWLSRGYLRDRSKSDDPFDDAIRTVYAWQPIPEAPEIPVSAMLPPMSDDDLIAKAGTQLAGLHASKCAYPDSECTCGILGPNKLLEERLKKDELLTLRVESISLVDPPCLFCHVLAGGGYIGPKPEKHAPDCETLGGDRGPKAKVEKIR